MKKFENTICPICNVRVNAEVLREETLKTVYKCEEVDKEGNPHSFSKHTTFGYVLKGGGAILSGAGAVASGVAGLIKVYNKINKI